MLLRLLCTFVIGLAHYCITLGIKLVKSRQEGYFETFLTDFDLCHFFLLEKKTFMNFKAHCGVLRGKKLFEVKEKFKYFDLELIWFI